jgi:hypothetical protein
LKFNGTGTGGLTLIVVDIGINGTLDLIIPDKLIGGGPDFRVVDVDLEGDAFPLASADGEASVPPTAPEVA